MLKKYFVLIVTALFAFAVLSGCRSKVYNQAVDNVANVKLRAAAARKKSDCDAKTRVPLIVKSGAYVDLSPINLEKEPTWLRNHIVIRGDQLPFSYYSRTVAGGAGASVLTKYQQGLDAATQVSVNYSGTVKGALDLLASKTGYVYTVHKNSIYWQAFVTKTFDIAFMPGGTDYLMGQTSSGGGGGGAASFSSGGGGGGGASSSNFTTSDQSVSEYSNLSGKLSVWTDVQNTIMQLLSPDGKVTVSQATTSVTVRDRPTNVELVSQYINNLNQNLSKQVLVKIQVLQVDLQNDFNFGIDWQLIVNAFRNSPFIVNGNYGTPVTLTALTPQTTFNGTTPSVPQFGTQGNGLIPSYTILFNALSQQGKTSVVSEPRVVCLNNQVSVIKIVSSQGYVASIQNTTLAAGGTAPTSTVTSQVTPGSVTTGITLYILPKIMGDKVYLQVNADLSNLKRINTFGPTNAEVQLPDVTEKSFNQRSVIRSGDTLILSGFRQVGNQANANQFLRSQALGGTAAQQVNAETIILITPIILNINGCA